MSLQGWGGETLLLESIFEGHEDKVFKYKKKYLN